MGLNRIRKKKNAASTCQQDVLRGGMTQLIYRHWSRAISAVPDGPPPHQRSRIRLQCGGGRARSQWLLVVHGVRYQLQLSTAVRSSRRGRVNVILFVFVFGWTIRSNTNRLFVSLFGSEANTKQIFGTAQIETNYNRLKHEKSL